MDVTYSSVFDAKRYAKAVRTALVLPFRGTRLITGCLVIAWMFSTFAWWLGGFPKEGQFMLWFLPFWFLIVWLRRRMTIQLYVRQMKRMLGDESATCRMTDSGYETICGDMIQKMPWRRAAECYWFPDDDTVALAQKGAMPVMVISDLEGHGVDRGELERALRQAGLKPAGERMRRRQLLLAVFGAIFIVTSAMQARRAVLSYRSGVCLRDVQIRLFEQIHGKNDAECPLPVKGLRARVVRALTGAKDPDECLYVFDPDVSYDKVGLFARYGDWSCEAYYPCGCVCEQNPGYFELIKALHKPTVYFESEKERWLEKVRPIAKSLYPDDGSCEKENSPCETLERK